MLTSVAAYQLHKADAKRWRTISPGRAATAKLTAAVTLSASFRARIADMQRGFWLPTDADREQVSSIRESFQLTCRDNVNIFLVPANMAHLAGSHITRPTTSQKLQRLQIKIRMAQAAIQDIQVGNVDPTLTEEEVAKKIRALERGIRNNQRAVNRENRRLSALPRSGWIIAVRSGSSAQPA